MAEHVRSDALKRFKALDRHDQRLVLDVLSHDEKKRLLDLLTRTRATRRAPRLSPWLAKHLAQLTYGKAASITPASRELLQNILAHGRDAA